MAVPVELLDRLRSLEGPLVGIRSAVNDALSANHDPEMLVTVREAVAALEAAAEQWLAESERIEAALLGYWQERNEDRNDVQARLGGVAMLHLAVAEDVAILVALDSAAEGTSMSNVQAELPDGASIIDDVAFGEGGLFRSLGEALDGGPEPDPFPSEAVEDLVERAGRATTALLLGLAPSPTALFGSISADLRDALNLAPADVRPVLTKMTGKVARLVVRLVHRARSAISSALGNYLPFVAEIIKTVDPASIVAESISGRVFGKVLHARDVLDRAEAGFARQPDKVKVGGRLGKLGKSHQKWVGPVRVVARGITHLWAVPIGPVPAAPVAAIALLGWAVVITGDMLDTRHYPDLWKGVVRVCQGET